MKILVSLLIFYVFSPQDAVSYALGGLYPPEEIRSEGLFLNPALILNSGKLSTALTFKNFYFMNDFREFSFSLSRNFKFLSLATGISSRNIPDVYSENTLLISFARKIRFLSTGLSIRIIDIRDPVDQLDKQAFSFDYGFSFRTGIFSFSFSHLNVLTPEISLLGGGEKSNSLIDFQISITKPSTVNWLFGFEKEGDREEFKIGSEMWFSRGFGVRLGLRERKIFMGLGLRTGTFGVNISFGSHRELGTTYVISTFYSL